MGLFGPSSLAFVSSGICSLIPFRFDAVSSCPFLLLRPKRWMLAELDSELRGLFDKHEVDKDVSAVFGKPGTTTSMKLARVASTETEFRTWAIKDLQLDRGLEDTVRISTLMEAWSDSRVRSIPRTRCRRRLVRRGFR